MSTRLPRSVAAAISRGSGLHQSGARELAILQLLRPSFNASLMVPDRFNSAEAELLAQIDRLSRPVALVGPAGVVHVNAAFFAAMGRHAVETLDDIVPHVRPLVTMGIAALDRPLSGSVLGPSGKRVVWSVHLLSPDHNQTFALIELEEPRTRHTAGMVSDRFGLTVRQAQVAVLMAARRTHKEIASQLAIRPNTARRHCEQVLLRLGVHSRDDVARLLDDLSQHQDADQPTDRDSVDPPAALGCAINPLPLKRGRP
jgi:DNA-binding CsgD family transcriptional regulator